MAERRKSFVLYSDYRQHLKLLKPEEQGQLLMSIFDYVEDGIEPEFDGMISMCWSFIRAQLDRDVKKYNSICEKRAKAGRNGGKQTQANAAFAKQTQANQANAAFAKQTQANQADNDNDTDTDNDNENENDTDTEIRKAAAAATARPVIDYQAILNDYNQTCTRLPKATKLSDSRRKAIAARLKSYTPAELHTVFRMAQDSDFLCGKNDRNWSASFDWLLSDRNTAKVLDGQYENKDSLRNGGEQSGTSDYYAKIFSDSAHNI